LNTVLREQRVRRLDFLQKSLDIASVGNVKPKGITQLAKFCARLIGEWERTGPEEAIPSGISVTKKAVISWKTLLRGGYRPYLDAWVEANNTTKKHDWNRQRIRELETQLIKLRAQYDLLHAQSLEWQDERPQQAIQTGQSLEEAFKSIQSLIEHFSDMVAVHDGSLISRSAARPTLINEARFSAFLAWRARNVSSGSA
jgi:hypothetical protein